MELHLLPILTFLLLLVAARSAFLPSEVHWNTVLPNTPMPKAVLELLRPDGVKDEIMLVQAGGTVSPADPFHYASGATKAQLETDPNVHLFFHEKDLLMGKTMHVQFFRTTTRTTFLPYHVARAIPFSSDKLHEVMHQFAVDPQSMQAKAMKRTVEICEGPAQEMEEKACATSLENMVDFSVSKLGRHIYPMSTEVDKEYTPQQQYKIAAEVEKVGENLIVCHTQTYAYAVFYCHTTRSTKTYRVPLVGGDGTKVMAVAVCHTDTAKWNPMHMGFQVLKVKPGTRPVCHFLPEDHIVWALK